MKTSRLVVYFLMFWVIVSCRDDDGDINPGTVVPPQTLAETQIENDAEIVSFLQTHFYNYEEFETPPAGFNFKIKFDTIAGANADKLPLIDFVQTQTIKEVSSTFGRDDEEEVDHILYFLTARVGEGDEENSPTIGDNTVLQYEGSLLDGTLFDAASTPVNQYLSGGLIRGYANGVEKFNAGIGPMENGDGTVSFENYGVGAIFIPSGLGYFSNPPTGSGIPAYAPLIFKIDLLAFEKDTDFDGDGIPSILEDVDGDGNLNNDNTDGDSEPFSVFLANHNDTDDDNDGIPTIDEIELDEDGKFAGFKDTDGDGTPDHLDNDN
ncbi:MAG: FKBP-type peptidyl-prolyl cis-trans isomerase [Maribacter sp.]|uniref:FKBP-type peptidyl-prolyl cis-trans isomerase n=1 Tax=Maribacter sp. TaxID=1897614 RepID=UPI0032984271